MSVQLPHSLIEEVYRGRASLFLGAGASREAGFPTADELAQHLVDRAGPELASLSGQPLDSVAQHLYMSPGYGQYWVRKEIFDYFESKHRQVKRPPSRAHHLLTRIKWRSIFTVNYDRLIEIAYDCSDQCVQRVLPIFSPDPQIRRHEEDVVRLIKLNGSVDEAARNSAHKLVLTFSEQMENRSRHGEFYNLLAEEAINGPIVFVGFRFVHPGATLAGTSPEFMILQQMLREMGPAARRHFCVTPSEKPVTPAGTLARDVIRGSQVDWIDATFGVFMDALVAQVGDLKTPLGKRPSIVVPVGQSGLRIDPGEYEKDRRQFEILGTYLEALEAPAVRESLNGGETWASFIHKHFIERSCKHDFIDTIQRASSHSPGLVVLSAPPGWGKTSLLRDIAVHFYRERRPVVWLNPYGTMEIDINGNRSLTIGSWDLQRLDQILASVSSLVDGHSVRQQDATTILIADDCPERAAEVLAMYRELAGSNRSFVLVFSVRENELKSLLDTSPLLKRALRFEPANYYDSGEEVRRLIDLCAQNEVTDISNPEQKEIVAQRIIGEEADEALILALQVIFDKQHRPFSEIVKDLWGSLESDLARQLVLRVASLNRFGSLFAPRLYSLLRTFPSHMHLEVLSAYRECLRKSILIETMEDEEPCVSCLHSLIAEQTIRASGVPYPAVDDELISLVRYMTANTRDQEMIRRMLKRIADYDINLSSDKKIEELYAVSADATDNDWVVCQQFAKYLANRRKHELALVWAQKALDNNPEYGPLHHTKGNVLRKWGMELQVEGRPADAQVMFQRARDCFATSRVKKEPDEYGYVTHLDMILYLMRHETDPYAQACLRAEGTQLYREGIRAVPEEDYNLLLDERFTEAFDLNESTSKALCAKIREALDHHRASVQAAVFLAHKLFDLGAYSQALEVLGLQREKCDSSVLLWTTEAEFHAKAGRFSEAAKCIDSAKRLEKVAENDEAVWRLYYWDLLVSTVMEEYGAAQKAENRIREFGFFSRKRFPIGYVWRDVARHIKPDRRILRDHAKVYTGRIELIKAGGQYGQIALTNMVGEKFGIGFTPRYFSRKDLRRGDHVEFVITILPNGIRADDISAKPFANTTADLFVPG